jgi:peptidyl-prolyl cis-trans isomerase B (cyclophilin B)
MTSTTQTLVDMTVSVDGNTVGTMTFEFWSHIAPATVDNFLKYVNDGFYNGKTFHRVIPGFMIQGGCPDGTGSGSGPNGNIKGEFTAEKDYSHKRGVLSMARSQNPDSASSQFFVCHGDATFLDNDYAAFGKLIAGEDALDAVAAVQTLPGDKPTQPCVIESMVARTEG